MGFAANLMTVYSIIDQVYEIDLQIAELSDEKRRLSQLGRLGSSLLAPANYGMFGGGATIDQYQRFALSMAQQEDVSQFRGKF